MIFPNPNRKRHFRRGRVALASIRPLQSDGQTDYGFEYYDESEDRKEEFSILAVSRKGDETRFHFTFPKGGGLPYEILIEGIEIVRENERAAITINSLERYTEKKA